jgi:regulator of protease activity HflC (stomatin/prohibitin superfamily)
MKKLLLALCLTLGLTACEKVPVGNVGIKVFLLGGEKGVDSEELGVGRYWIGFNEELYIFPTFMQNYEWTADSRSGSESDQSFSFQTTDGMVASADIGISYSLDPTKVPKIFATYRRGVEEITDIFLRNMVRDALAKEASSKPIEYIYGAGKSELIEKIQADVTARVADIGIIINQIYWLGEIRVPPQVIESINAKITATQLTQQRVNEVQQVKAESDKAIEKARGTSESLLIEARAQAEANRVLAESLTDALIQFKSIDRWDGVLPTTMLPGNTVPMISLPKAN